MAHCNGSRFSQLSGQKPCSTIQRSGRPGKALRLHGKQPENAQTFRDFRVLARFFVTAPSFALFHIRFFFAAASPVGSPLSNAFSRGTRWICGLFGVLLDWGAFTKNSPKHYRCVFATKLDCIRNLSIMRPSVHQTLCSGRSEKWNNKREWKQLPTRTGMSEIKKERCADRIKNNFPISYIKLPVVQSVCVCRSYRQQHLNAIRSHTIRSGVYI